MRFFITSQHIVTAAVKPGKMAKQTEEWGKEKKQRKADVCVGRGEEERRKKSEQQRIGGHVMDGRETN